MDGIQQRSFLSLDGAEQARQEKHKRRYKALHDVMVLLAQALRGEALEQARTTQPHVPDNWDAADWHSFWFGESRITNPEIGKTWGEVTLDEAEENPAVLGMPEFNVLDAYKAIEAVKHIDELRQSINVTNETHRNEIARKNELIANLEQTLTLTRKMLAKEQHVPIEEVKEATTSTPIQVDREQESLEKLFAKELKIWYAMTHLDALPGGWESTYSSSQSPSRISKIQQLLFAIYTLNMYHHIEIGWFIKLLSSLSPGSGSLNRCLQDLKDNQIIIEHKDDFFEQGFKTNYTYYVLTNKGKALCRDWGLPESGTTPITEKTGTDTKKGLLLLTYVLHARMRQWSITLMPASGADLEIGNEQEKYSVLIVTEDDADNAVLERIKRIQSENAPAVGFVTISNGHSTKLAKYCKDQNTPVHYTDIYNLLNKKPGGKDFVPYTLDDYLNGASIWLE